MTSASNKFSRIYYPQLDTLRGLAILMIIFYHCFYIVPFAVFGSLGVDLFFVLSGFLITDILLRSKGNHNFLRNFYIRRALRIFPVYFLTLFLLIFILPAIFHVVYNVQYYRLNQRWFYMFIQNYLFILKPLEKTSLLNHFWSLATEEQFYLLWPVVILFLKKMNRLMYILFFLLIFIFLGRLLLLSFYTRNNLFYIFSRFDGLIVGCLLAIFLYNGFTITKRLLLFILGALLLINLSFLPVASVMIKGLSYFSFCGYTTFSILFGLLAYYAITNKSSTEKTPLYKKTLQKTLQFFGKISYGLYIYHWPVYVFLMPPARNIIVHFFHWRNFVTFLIASVITTMVSIILSILSYRYFERMFLSLKKQYPQ